MNETSKNGNPLHFASRAATSRIRTFTGLVSSILCSFGQERGTGVLYRGIPAGYSARLKGFEEVINKLIVFRVLEDTDLKHTGCN